MCSRAAGCCRSPRTAQAQRPRPRTSRPRGPTCVGQWKGRGRRKSTASPYSSCKSSRRLRICAWMETSRALTGSSQTRRDGRSASARAMAIRWRWPPGASCGYLRAAPGGGDPPRPGAPKLARAGRSASSACWMTSGSSMIEPTGSRGFRESAGSWKTICTARRSPPSLRSGSVPMSLPSKRHPAAGGAVEAEDAAAEGALPAPRLSHDPQRLPAGHGQAHVLQRVHHRAAAEPPPGQS